MKELIECKEYYKDLYKSCLEVNAFEKSIYESTERAQYETFCETLKFIYGPIAEKTLPIWSQEAIKEFYK